MPRRPGVPVRQRRVSTELRRLRTEAGLTCSDAAKALDVSITKISRMETGERGLYADEVAALLGLYRVPTKLRRELLDLVRNGQDPNWWQMRPGNQPAGVRDLIQFEQDATAIANFEPTVVPGLLQTDEYASAFAYGTDDTLSESEVKTVVATRMARQVHLTARNAPTLHAIVDEMVLRRPVGAPGVMKRQLQHLLACTQRPNITIQVVPIAAGATTAMEGPLMLIDLSDGSSVVHLETRRAGGFLSEEPHVREIKLAWRRLRAVALVPDKSGLSPPSRASDRVGDMMTAPDLSWRKSTFSTNQTNCVEVAFAEPTAVAVRDSKNQDGPTLAVPAVTWHSFISRVGSR